MEKFSESLVEQVRAISNIFNNKDDVRDFGYQKVTLLNLSCLTDRDPSYENEDF